MFKCPNCGYDLAPNSGESNAPPVVRCPNCGAFFGSRPASSLSRSAAILISALLFVGSAVMGTCGISNLVITLQPNHSADARSIGYGLAFIGLAGMFVLGGLGVYVWVSFRKQHRGQD